MAFEAPSIQLEAEGTQQMKAYKDAGFPFLLGNASSCCYSVFAVVVFRWKLYVLQEGEVGVRLRFSNPLVSKKGRPQLSDSPSLHVHW